MKMSESTTIEIVHNGMDCTSSAHRVGFARHSIRDLAHMSYKSDIEIAREASKQPIQEIGG
ncbi:hypothetical protein, partial [uncultured Ruegeria sp.]|uniref:hypothetical protein n=1 Tax=uncultured Ruegeria sp. TaxID=259304 RepID=UPI0026153277